MVLNIKVHELLSEQSKYNSLQDEYKSLIPTNNIPDKKLEYHKNMIEHSEKTIEISDKKFKKKKKEIKVEKEDIDNEENVTDDFSFDEIIQIPDEPIEPDSESDDEELELNIDESDEDDGKENNKEDDKENDKEEDKEDDKEGDKGSEEKKQIPDDLLLDVMKMVEKKEKGEIKKEKHVNITIPDEPKIEQEGGSVKRIKLDQHYNFF
jgi:hypothetical protein